MWSHLSRASAECTSILTAKQSMNTYCCPRRMNRTRVGQVCCAGLFLFVAEEECFRRDELAHCSPGLNRSMNLIIEKIRFES